MTYDSLSLIIIINNLWFIVVIPSWTKLIILRNNTYLLGLYRIIFWTGSALSRQRPVTMKRDNAVVFFSLFCPFSRLSILYCVIFISAVHVTFLLLLVLFMCRGHNLSNYGSKKYLSFLLFPAPTKAPVASGVKSKFEGKSNLASFR